MYDETLEILSKIEMEKTENSDGSIDIKLRAHLDTSEVSDLCNNISKHSPYEPDGFRFWYEILETDDICKIFFFLRKCSTSNTLPEIIELACDLTLTLVREAIQVPCQIEIIRRKEGYFEAVEQKLTHYVPIEDFEKAHEKCHEVISIVSTSFETGGWIRKLHLN